MFFLENSFASNMYIYYVCIYIHTFSLWHLALAYLLLKSKYNSGCTELNSTDCCCQDPPSEGLWLIPKTLKLLSLLIKQCFSSRPLRGSNSGAVMLICDVCYLWYWKSTISKKEKVYLLSAFFKGSMRTGFQLILTIGRIWSTYLILW